MQATVAANDGDFVIPTVKPLSRGSSRHSILLSSGHEAANSRGLWHPEPSKHSSTRKTSFRLVKDAVHEPEAMQAAAGEEGSLSPQPQQEEQSKRLALEPPAQARSGGMSVTSQHHHEAVTRAQDQAPLDAEGSQEVSDKGAVDKQHLEQAHSQSLSEASLTKQAQRRTKAMRPLQDWVGIGSKRQLHK